MGRIGNMSHINIKHFENGDKNFDNEDDFILFMQGVFNENEEKDTELKPITNFHEALDYLTKYCGNWVVV